jgi:hypothetical protein
MSSGMPSSRVFSLLKAIRPPIFADDYIEREVREPRFGVLIPRDQKEMLPAAMSLVRFQNNDCR